MDLSSNLLYHRPEARFILVLFSFLSAMVLYAPKPLNLLQKRGGELSDRARLSVCFLLWEGQDWDWGNEFMQRHAKELRDLIKGVIPDIGLSGQYIGQRGTGDAASLREVIH